MHPQKNIIFSSLRAVYTIYMKHTFHKIWKMYPFSHWIFCTSCTISADVSPWLWILLFNLFFDKSLYSDVDICCTHPKESTECDIFYRYSDKIRSESKYSPVNTASVPRSFLAPSVVLERKLGLENDTSDEKEIISTIMGVQEWQRYSRENRLRTKQCSYYTIQKKDFHTIVQKRDKDRYF